MTHLESIDKSLNDKLPHLEIVRKIYLTYPTMALVGDEERQFKILNSVSNHFVIPINNIHVVGSAKTGNSFHKNTPFIPMKSDLDIAIIDPNLFRYYTERVFEISKGFTDLTVFPVKHNVSTFKSYSAYVSKGVFRPDWMPVGQLRASWFKFFGQLSFENKDLFGSINAGIYFSQTYFEHKQLSMINYHISNKKV